ncbi:MAG: hypothetical protein E7483_03280 [Ruminococcaceae bacterium]|nr:hypothetical protein [Oscillospiraceae bacterium]
MDFTNKSIPRFTKVITLSVFFILYLAVLWFSFNSKGIYLDGHFYKKSANLTTVTYTCRNPFAHHKKIVLQKQVDKSVITIDGSQQITVNKDSSWQQTAGSTDAFVTETDWVYIAQQKAETTRGNARKQPYFIVFIIYILFALSKIFSAKIYEFFFRGKAAGEKYYKIFDIVFDAVTAVVLIYFILPL